LILKFPEDPNKFFEDFPFLEFAARGPANLALLMDRTGRVFHFHNFIGHFRSTLMTNLLNRDATDFYEISKAVPFPQVIKETN